MQINKNRKGLALGAALSLFASLFAGAMPASANTDGQYIALTPAAGPVTNFNGTLAEDFQLTAYALPGQTKWTDSDTVHFEVTRVSGAMDVLFNATSISTAIPSGTTRASGSGTVAARSISGVVEAGSTSGTASVVASASNGVAYLNVQAYTSSPGIVSSSPTTTVLVKVWRENPATANGVHDPLEWFTTKTVVLHSPNAIPATVTIGAPQVGDTVITASGTVSALNFENLTGKFFLQLTSTVANFEPALQITVSPTALGQKTLADRAGVITHSFAISTSAPLSSSTSISGFITYQPDGSKTAGSSGTDVAAGNYRLGALSTAVVSGTKAATLAVDVISNSNAVQVGTTATVRANQTYTFRVTATSGSTPVSVSGAVVSVKLSSSAALSLNVKEISVNGAASTTSWPAALSVTTGANGTATFTVATSGFAGNESFTVIATEQNVSKSLTVNVEGTKNSVTADYSQIAMAPGTTTPVTFSIKDQFGQSSTATNLRLMVTKAGSGFSYTDTVSYVAVVAGKATFNFTPTPATKTGSAEVQVALQELQAATGAYVAVSPASTATVEVNVSATTDAFGTGLRASYSSSVSYFPSTLADAVVVTGKVTNTGSAVVLTGTGLVFEDASGDTYSDTVTVRADGTLTYTVNVYGTVAGTYTLTLTNGAASTTSQFIVNAAGHDSGRNITFDTTAIEAGKTRVITGKVTDMNGNPVATGNTASILVTFAGSAGIPVGAMPTQTNADGEFQVSILTTAADRGSFTLTASYLKAGAATLTKDVVTVAQPITVGAAIAAPASDQKLTVGSFKGFVAIYALNYTGSKLSAKVAGKWLVVEELNRFQRVVRNTGAGFTIIVDLYIDREFVRSETIVTK